MPIEVLMPALSPTMKEGNLAKWHKQEGDPVKSGDLIAEIETDKATMEVEAVDEGVLGKILVKEGTEGVAVNELIALILEDGEDKKSLDSYKGKKTDAKKEAPKESTSEPTPAPSPAPAPKPSPSFTAPSQSGRVFSSPLARRIADMEGIQLSQIQGTGPRGRVVKADVLEAVASGGASSGVVRRNPMEYAELPNNNMRKVIAKRLLESKQTVPHFYLTVDCNLDNLLEVRAQINKEAEGKYKLSVNDFVIRATALALKKIPEANATWTDAAILRYNNVDVSVAVAIDGGLITPIIRNADQKTLPNISKEMKDLAVRAKENKLAPEEFQGGGFSISNLGMYGIKQFNAIINPPQSCILAVGVGEQRPVIRDGKVEVSTIMEVTLSSDHRVVDGAVGAEFLTAFKKFIEQPVLMFV